VTAAVDVAVIGAGIFGACTAQALAENGIQRVLLLDAWGAGNPRATSSDASRIMRSAYGEKCIYSRWAWESLGIWKRWEQETGTQMFLPTGVLWLLGEDSHFASASSHCLRDLAIPFEEWPAGQAARRFPQFAGIEDRAAIFEPEGGVLLAHQALLAIARRNRIEIGSALPPVSGGNRLDLLKLADGRTVSAGAYVFACGPWLRELFPSLLGARMRVTQQEVFYFAPPPALPPFPAWIDEGSRAAREFSYYGLPALGPGIKVACDNRGPEFDPTNGDRRVSAESLAAARDYLARRVPALAGADLVESRVCQYEQTPDSHLIVDRHPQWENVWIAGGGSGHGFKLGPAVGRCVAECVRDNNRRSIPEPLRVL
jgi:sarcosine oxidase